MALVGGCYILRYISNAVVRFRFSVGQTRLYYSAGVSKVPPYLSSTHVNNPQLGLGVA